MSIVDWSALVGAVVTGLGGVAALLRFMVKHYLAELKPNGGGSMKDTINQIKAEQKEQRELLMQILLKNL